MDAEKLWAQIASVGGYPIRTHYEQMARSEEYPEPVRRASELLALVVSSDEINEGRKHLYGYLEMGECVAWLGSVLDDDLLKTVCWDVPDFEFDPAKARTEQARQAALAALEAAAAYAPWQALEQRHEHSMQSPVPLAERRTQIESEMQESFRAAPPKLSDMENDPGTLDRMIESRAPSDGLTL